MTEDKNSLRQHFLLWRNRLHFQISMRRCRWFFELVFHESLKPFVKVAKILLTLIGLFSAFVAFHSVIVSFLFGLVVFLLTTIIEKGVFSYNSLFVHQLPTFTIEPDKWLGAFFGYAQASGGCQIPMIGWIMGDTEYARKVHSLLLSWSYGKLVDEQKNISASVIVDGTDYVFFCYPSMNRKTAEQFYESVEAERKKVSLTDVHNRISAMLIFGKRCQITPNSYFPNFRKRWRDGVPVLFRLALPRPDGQVDDIPGLKDFVLFDLKIKDKQDLTRKDLEYDHFRLRE